MATITWTGAANDGLFSDANNWQGDTLPGTADVAIIAPASATTITSGTAGSPIVSEFSMNVHVTLDINASTGFTALNGTTGSGIAGTINIANNAGLSLYGTSTNSGTINITNSAVLSLAGVLTNSGTINEQSTVNTTEIALAQSTTLTGGGHVVLTGSTSNYIFGNTFTLDNLNNTISGGGTIGNNEMALVNAGIINANDSGVLLLVNPNNNTTNSGTMEASSGGTLELYNYTVTNYIVAANGTVATGGTVEAVGAGSTLVLQTTLAGGTITASGGGTVESNDALLDGQALHPVTVNGPIQILNDETLYLAGTIINNSSIELSAAANTTSLRIDSPIVTLQGTGTISLNANTNNVIDGTQQYFELINHSNTITGGGQLGSGFMTLVNQSAGVINASSIATLTLDTVNEVMVNQGLVEATNTGDLLVYQTLIDNAGGTVRASGAGDEVLLQSSAIDGGTLSTASGGLIATSTSNPSELDGFSTGVLTNQGTVQVADDTRLELAGTINNTGTISVQSTADSTQLIVNSYSVALTGGGQVALSNNSANLIIGNAAFRLTNVNNTISGAGNIGNNGSNPFVFVNQATINANQTTALVLVDGSQIVTNTGTMEATNAGGLLIDSTIVDNAGGTILASGTGDSVGLQSADIQGGNLVTASGGVIDTTDRGSALDGITQGAVNNKGTLKIADSTYLTVYGTINNTGTIALASSSNTTQLIIAYPTVLLTGGGQVTMSATTTNNILGSGKTTNELVNVNNTISGAGNIGTGLTMFLDNQGLINANLSVAMTLDTGSNLLTNTSTLEDTGAGGLVIQGTAVDNQGGTIFATGTNNHVVLNGADIEGGILNTASAGAIATIGRSNGMDGITNGAVTNKGSVAIADDTSLTFAGSIINDGTIGMNSVGSVTQFIVGNPLVTLTGGGQVILSNNTNNEILGNSNEFELLNVNNTISGGGGIGNGSSNPFFLVNQATIDADQGAALTVNTGPDLVTNTGTMEATGTGDLVLSCTVNNVVGTLDGTILANGTTALLQLAGAYIEGGNLVTTGGGTISTSSNSNLDGITTGAVNNKGLLSVTNSTSLGLIGVIDNTGTIALNSAGSATSLVIAYQTATLTGNGQVLLADNPNNEIIGNGVQHTLINNGNTISGSGQIGTNNMDFVNQSGTVQGTGTNPLVFSLGTGTGVNKSGAWIIAKGTASLQLQSGIFSNAGDMEALGSTLVYEPSAINTNLIEGTLSGGNWRAIASGTLGATLEMNGGPITTDAAVITLFGAGTTIEGGNGSSFTPIEQSLTAIAAGGTLQVQGSRGYTTTLDLSVSGLLQVGGGTVTAAGVTINAGGRLLGFGTISDAPINNGTIEAAGPLKLTGNVTSTGTLPGTLQIDNVSTLELGGSAAETVNFASGATAGVLKIDTAKSFTGDITNANVGDVIDLVNIAPASITSVSWLNHAPELIVLDNSTTLVSYPSVTGVTGVAPATDHWAITSDGSGGTDLTLTAGASTSGITGGISGGSGSGSGAITGGVKNNDPSWIGGSGNGFDTAANWSPAVVPTSTADAVIGSGFSVLSSSGSDAVNSITVGNNSTLTVGGPNNTAFQVLNGTDPAGITGTIDVDDYNSLYLGGTISNAGSILLLGTGDNTNLDFTQAVNFLTGGGKVILSNNPNNRIYTANGNASFVLTNVNNTISGAGQLGAAQMTFINSGTVTANQTNPLILNTSNNVELVTNTGTMQDTGTGGLQIQSTTVVNAGGTIQSSGAGSHVDLVSGSIQGGTINGLIDTVGNGNSIDGLAAGALTNNGTVLVTDNTQLWLLGTINNTGTILDDQVSTTGNAAIRLGSQAVTLQGGGQFILNNNNAGNELGVSSGNNTLINVNNTISGAGQIGIENGGASLALVNETDGVIDANQNPTFLQSGQLTLDTAGNPPTAILNAGILESTAAGGLLIRDSTVNNTGGTLGTVGTIEAVGATAVVDLSGAAIEGGTLATSGGGVIQTIIEGSLSTNATLDGLDLGPVNNTGTVLVNDQTTLYLQGVINNTGTILLDQVSTGGNTEIQLNSQDVTLTGGGQVQLSNASGNQIYGHSGNGTLINANNTISGAGQLGAAYIEGFTNETAGVVDANQTNPLVLNTQGAVTTNAGKLEATNGGTLLIQSTTVANAGGTIESSGTGSVVGLQGGNPGLTIEGGTIAAGSLVEAEDRSSTLDGYADGAVTNAGTVQVNNADALFLNGTFDNTGTIQLAGIGYSTPNYTDLVIESVVILQGGGSVLMSVSGNGPGNDRIYANSGSVPYQLINVNNTIAGAGQLGVTNNTLNITNEAAGVIDANLKEALVLGVQGNSFIYNQGKIEATSTALLNGGLVLSNTNINNAGGTIQAVGSGGTNAFAHVDMDNSAIQGGTLTSSGGGIIQTLTGTTFNFLDGASAGVLNNTGTIVVNDDSRLQLAGTIHNTGTLLQNAFSTPASGDVTDVEVVQAPGQSVGVVTLTGGGQWIMKDNPMNRVYGANNAFTLVNDGNTIEGAGQITDVLGAFNFTNTLGTLNAFGTNALFITLGAGFSTNNALMSATGAGGMVLVNGLYINNGKMLASDGSSITFQSPAVNTNLTEGVLVGGTWEAAAAGHGATLSMTGGPIDVDDGVLIVSGAGSVIQAGSGTGATPYTQIEQTMSSIAAGAQLQVLANRNYTTPLAFDSFGTIQLGGGTLQAGISTNEVPGVITGFGTVNNGLLNQGTIVANGGTLTLPHVIGASGINDGTLEANAGAELVLTGPGAGAGVVVNNGSLFVSAVTTLAVLTSFSGSGAVTDNGTITLSAGDNFSDTGAVSVVGKLQLAGGTLTAGTLTVASTGTLFGFGTVTNAVANSGRVEANGGTLTMSGAVTGTGTLQVDSGAAATLGGASNMEAAVVNNGTVTLKSGDALTVSGNASGTGAYVVNSTSTLTLNGTSNTAGAITENGGLTLGTNATLTASGTVSGTGTVAVNSGGLLTLNSGTNSIASLSDSGTVSMGTNDNLTVTGTATVNGTIHPHGGTLSAVSLVMGPSSLLIGFGTVSDAVASAKQVEANGGTLTITGAVTSAGTLQSDSGAVLVLNGAANSAATVTDNGTIKIGSNTLTATGTVTVGATGSLVLAGGKLGAAGLAVLSGGVLSGSGSVTPAPANAGRIEASGGTLAVGGAVTGAGTLQADSGAVLNLNGVANSQASVLDNSTINIGGSDSLDVTGSVNSASTGLFVLTNASLLEVAADTGGSSQISFLGASGDKLVVDAVGSFGTNVGAGAYTGPLLENFASVDTIDLKNLLFSTASIVSYTSASGLLQLSSGSTKATLLFQNSSLGSGSFHIAADSGTGTLITHS